MQIVIYKNDDGVLAILWPTPEALSLHTIKQIADKDVPAGKPYRIIDHTDLPADREARDRWTIDDALLIDGVGGESATYGDE